MPGNTWILTAEEHDYLFRDIANYKLVKDAKRKKSYLATFCRNWHRQFDPIPMALPERSSTEPLTSEEQQAVEQFVTDRNESIRRKLDWRTGGSESRRKKKAAEKASASAGSVMIILDESSGEGRRHQPEELFLLKYNEECVQPLYQRLLAEVVEARRASGLAPLNRGQKVSINRKARKQAYEELSATERAEIEEQHSQSKNADKPKKKKKGKDGAIAAAENPGDAASSFTEGHEQLQEIRREEEHCANRLVMKRELGKLQEYWRKRTGYFVMTFVGGLDDNGYIETACIQPTKASDGTLLVPNHKFGEKHSVEFTELSNRWADWVVSQFHLEKKAASAQHTLADKSLIKTVMVPTDTVSDKTANTPADTGSNELSTFGSKTIVDPVSEDVSAVTNSKTQSEAGHHENSTIGSTMGLNNAPVVFDEPLPHEFQSPNLLDQSEWNVAAMLEDDIDNIAPGVSKNDPGCGTADAEAPEMEWWGRFWDNPSIQNVLALSPSKFRGPVKGQREMDVLKLFTPPFDSPPKPPAGSQTLGTDLTADGVRLTVPAIPFISENANSTAKGQPASAVRPGESADKPDSAGRRVVNEMNPVAADSVRKGHGKVTLRAEQPSGILAQSDVLNSPTRKRSAGDAKLTEDNDDGPRRGKRNRVAKAGDQMNGEIERKEKCRAAALKASATRAKNKAMVAAHSVAGGGAKDGGRKKRGGKNQLV